MRYAMTPERHAALFGAQEHERGTGRARLCKTCGGWHEAGRVPHNCRRERPPRSPLTAPQIAPPFGSFLTSRLPDQGEVIATRAQRADYMARNDLQEYDPGEGARVDWVEELKYRDGIVQDMKRVFQMDRLEMQNPELQPERINEGGSLEDGTEIETDGIEVAT